MCIFFFIFSKLSSDNLCVKLSIVVNSRVFSLRCFSSIGYETVSLWIQFVVKRTWKQISEVRIKLSCLCTSLICVSVGARVCIWIVIFSTSICEEWKTRKIQRMHINKSSSENKRSHSDECALRRRQLCIFWCAYWFICTIQSPHHIEEWPRRERNVVF